MLVQRLAAPACPGVRTSQTSQKQEKSAGKISVLWRSSPSSSVVRKNGKGEEGGDKDRGKIPDVATLSMQKANTRTKVLVALVAHLNLMTKPRSMR